MNLKNFFKNQSRSFAYIFISSITILFVILYLTNIIVPIKNNYYFFYNSNILGLSLLYTGAISGFLVFIFSDTKIFFKKSLNIFFLFFFLICIWLFINESNVFNLFFLYELFLLPSFFLVYRLSPNRRSIIASIYFLTWTQFGSLLVLIGIIINFFYNNSINIDESNLLVYNLSFWFIFIGFGIKIPMWPFYYWLTKTHVEASSFFSMYLSGFLVKTAVFLFIKFYSIISISNYINVFFILFIIGIIDSSIKMWHQTDLKKLIAYTTVQEMNFLCIPILFNDFFSENLTAFFIITHCLLSNIFFFYIDIIYKRFNTRVTSQITGISTLMPNFFGLMFISWIMFSGLPFTIKFLLEIGIFTSLFKFSFVNTVFVLVIMNVFGILGFTKNIFNSFFGYPILNETIVYDLVKREFLLLTFMILNLVLLNIFTIFLW